MKRLLVLLGSAIALLSILVLLSCAQQHVGPAPSTATGTGQATTVAPAPQQAPAAPAVKVAGPYQKEVSPLTADQCAQCHPSYYDIIRKNGGKHQLECAYCHSQFHTYRPGKVTYEDVLPKCTTCHGLAHGEKLAKCTECHANAHAPTYEMTGAAMDAGCSSCHGAVAAELQANKSKHTDLACSECHTKHRFIPVCATCHEPHQPTQTNADCLACHPVHKPLVIAYPVTTPQEACAGCHKKAMDQLSASQTKHTLLTCAKCHPKHRQLMKCQECHGQAHNPAMLKGFKGCGDCHNTAHALPKS